jgi:hypothetical protein
MADVDEVSSELRDQGGVPSSLCTAAEQPPGQPTTFICNASCPLVSREDMWTLSSFCLLMLMAERMPGAWYLGPKI